ncbi:MAG TPA: hypothetical protein VJU16_06765 [Planctomycetota bacterium]|nr:hypothetical protein [Planctomycetota bacterium]
MKLNVPVVVGAGVVVAGLAVLVLWQPEPKPEEVAAASLAKIRAELREKGGVEGQHFVLEPPVILSRTDAEVIVRLEIKFPGREPGREYHRLIRGGQGWEFDRDLGRSFTDFVKAEEKAASERLGKRLAERYQDAVNIPAGNVRIGARLREAAVADSTDVRVLGSIEIRFLDGGGEGRYIEDFSFANGKWTMEGLGGALFDRGPRSK